MIRPSLHFVHGNSFPTGTYRVFLDLLRRHFEVQALDMHAHNPRYPVQNGWESLARELIDDMARRYQEPVILVGHSMGGMLSLMAAKARPDLVRCVVLLDSPVVAGWRASLLRFAKKAGLDRHFSPAKASEKRRDRWSSREVAYEHYASKPMFAAWDRQALRDYVDYGLVEDGQGVTLRFKRDIETAVYRTLPDYLGKAVRRFPVPVGFIGGANSRECRQAGLSATRRLVGRHFQLVAGGHLFPMESPGAAAHAVHDMIHSLTKEQEKA